jgi:DNA-binding MarR family transcriptional regulator
MAEITLPQNAPDPHQVEGFLLWKSALRWEKSVSAKFQPFGLSQSESFYLICLWGLQETTSEVTQTQLAYHIGATTMNASKILRSLEKKQFVTRKKAKDSRAKALEITTNGKQLLLETAPVLWQANLEFFGKQNPEFLTKLQQISQ